MKPISAAVMFSTEFSDNLENVEGATGDFSSSYLDGGGEFWS